MKNLILIGMPGVGKSTIGVVLAKRLGYCFLDTDLLIQETYQARLHELIAAHGTDGFLQLEDDTLAQIETEHTVIATGGSAVYGKEAMEHLKKNGTVIYLKLPLQELKKRLGDLKKRGVVLKENQTLYDLFAERNQLYERYADIRVECSGKDIREIVEEIDQRLDN